MKKILVHLSSPFYISAIIGIIYGFMIYDETIRGYMNIVLPSKDGPDIHQYLPVVIAVVIYSYISQKKQRNFLKIITFSCLNICIAILSCFVTLIALLTIQDPW